MKSSAQQVKQALLQFANQYTLAHREKHGQLPTIERDADWPSPCLQGQQDQDNDFWRPVEVNDGLSVETSFDNVEQALEMELHQDFKAYFTSIYSESLAATCEHGGLELLFIWSKDDLARLQENIIGHVVMKRRLKQQVSLFFAVTDEEDNILVLNNETGEVFVEQVGREPSRKLADSLAEFIEQLTPVD